ncbi:MAG: Hsp20/alpha crystallin family protein [Amnibacterium sp.]
MPKNLERFDPLAELANLQKQLFDDGWLSTLRAPRRPAIDVYTEDDKQLTVEAHLPDFSREDISVDLDDDALVIQAQRHEREEDKKKKYVVRETSATVYRRIPLPEQADRDHIAADLKDGVLKVVVPFTAAATPKRIPIGDTAAAA